MRKMTSTLLGLLGLFACLSSPAGLLAQVQSRSSVALKTAEISGSLPCSGSTIFFEDFESGIPAGWTVIDGDNKDPRPEMLLQKGWQGIVDYRDTSNHVAASPSWYIDPGQSDDWLITPKIAVGANSCLSWKAYSQDQYFKENFEVRVASSLDTNAFLANAALATITAQSANPDYASASLSQYAGDSVYIAFRQVSDDKFVLCLDEILVSNVNNRDIGVVAVTHGNPEPGDSVRFTFEVANYGSDTITTFSAFYQIPGGSIKNMAITATSLAPNQTVTFVHDSLYVSDSLDAWYDICAWTLLPNGGADQDISNDTLCTRFYVGSPVAVQPIEPFEGLEIFPNPFNNALNLWLENGSRMNGARFELFDLQGRLEFSQVLQFEAAHCELNLPENLPAGMHIARISKSGKVLSRKLMKY